MMVQECKFGDTIVIKEKEYQLLSTSDIPKHYIARKQGLNVLIYVHMECECEVKSGT